MRHIPCCIFLLLLFSGCKTTYQTVSPNYISGDASQLKVRSIGVGKNEIEAIEYAQQAAISTLLFRGYPGSQQKDPLVGVSEEEIKSIHKDYFERLWKKERYKSFITSVIPVSDVTKHEKNLKQITVEVTINIRALRNDLEYYQVIRKFGF